ncbi:MAG: DUF4832 domain-containing protein [Ilumatobacteraceae bacterium]
MKNIHFSICYLMMALIVLPASCAKHNLLNKVSSAQGLSTSATATSFSVDTLVYLTGNYADGPNSISPQNPDRGFRGEISINATTLKNQFSNIDYSSNFGDAVLGEFKSQTASNDLSDSLDLMQVYVYLSNEATVALSSQTLTNIQYIINELKRVKAKTVLRFSYDDGNLYEGSGSTALHYTVQNIQQHLSQLQSLLAQNQGQIPVLEAGFVGDWGEWGSNYYMFRSYNDATAVIMSSIVNALPSSRQMVLRYVWLKTNALNGGGTYTQGMANRSGYHNDYFTGGLMNNGSDFIPGSSDYNSVMANTKTYKLWMDGEMPYYDTGSGTYAFHSLINAWTVLKIFAQHRYTSFSIAHNNMEYNGTGNTNIRYWRNNSISLTDFINNNAGNAPVDSAYFRTQAGSYVTRTYFDYFKDHFGYRLILKDFGYKPTFNTSDTSFTVKFDLTNRGFSNPINSRPVYLAFVNKTTHAVITIPLNADAQNWDVASLTASYQVSATLSRPSALTTGSYFIGLWLPEASSDLRMNAAYCIRLCNNEVNYWRDSNGQYLINVIGSVTVR